MARGFHRPDHRRRGQLYAIVNHCVHKGRQVPDAYGYLVTGGSMQPRDPLARANDVQENSICELEWG